MKKLFIVIILCVLSMACQNIEMPEKPDDLIDRNTMVEILVDTYLSNAVRSKNFQEVKDENIRLEKYIYEKYAIDSLQFVKSNAYYTADMDGYLKLLYEVEQKLNNMKGEEEVVLEPNQNSKPKANKDIHPEDDEN